MTCLSPQKTQTTIASIYLDVRELGKHHVGCGGMEGWKLPIQVGKTHQRSEQDLGLYSWSLERRRRRKKKKVERRMEEMQIKWKKKIYVPACTVQPSFFPLPS